MSLCLQSLSVHAQNEPGHNRTAKEYTRGDSVNAAEAAYEKLNKSFIVNSIKDGAGIATSPMRWQKKDWLHLSILAGTAGGLMLLDKDIKKIALHNQNPFSGSIANVAEPLGSIYGLAAFPAIYLTGWAIKNPHIESIGLRGGKAMAISSAICFTGKNIIRRQRPDRATSPFNYAPPFSKVKYTSFPSAHSCIAFTLATAFAMEFPDKKWIAPVAYSIASLTAVSRVYHNRHWASDVLIGAALGHFVTKAVYNRGKKQRPPAKTFK